jgi:hypothetical protein
MSGGQNENKARRKTLAFYLVNDMAFERLKQKMADTIMRTGASTGLGKEYKSIFDLDGVPAFNQFYNIGIFNLSKFFNRYGDGNCYSICF